MKGSKAGWWMAAIVLSLTTETLSQECSPPLLDNQNNTKWTINSQYDLDNLANDCTTLNGDLEIASIYSGEVNLDRVTTITGEISIARSNAFNETTSRDITSIHLPNLTSLGSLYLNLPDQDIVFIDLPNLTDIDSLAVVDVRSSLWAPELISAASIELNSGVDELDLSSLETITTRLSLCSTPDCLPATGSPIPVSFPALNNVTDARIIGTLSTLDLSSLTYAAIRHGAAPHTRDPGLSIGNYGSPMGIDLPRLKALTGLLELAGEISEFSIPELEVTQAEIRITATTALDVRLADLENADSVVLEGRISSAEFPALQSINNLVINSTLNMSCQGFRDARQRAYYDVETHRGGDISCKSSSSDGETENGEDDEDDEDDDEGGLSGAALGGIAVGVAASLVIGSLGVIMWVISARRKKKPPSQRDVELMERQRQRDRMRMRGANERPGTPPPPYTPPAPEYEEVDPNRSNNGDANANEDGRERGGNNRVSEGNGSNERNGNATG